MPKSPYRLTVLTLAAGLLVSAGFLVPGLPLFHAYAHFKAAWLVFMVASLTGMYGGAATLRRGIRTERWPANLIAPARRLSERRVWNWILGLSLVGMLAALLRTTPHPGYVMAAAILLQTMMEVRSSLRYTEDPGGSVAPLNLSHVSALSSEHWGKH